jgi:hypothetical protein
VSPFFAEKLVAQISGVRVATADFVFFAVVVGLFLPFFALVLALLALPALPFFALFMEPPAALRAAFFGVPPALFFFVFKVVLLSDTS